MALVVALASASLNAEADASAASKPGIDPEASVFAVVTHKAGIGAGLAHNHLVVAAAPEVTLRFDPKAPGSTRLSLEATVEGLVIDDPTLQKRWYHRIEALGILEEPFSTISEKNRGKIRVSALAKNQLNAEAFPKLSARLLSVEEKTTTLGETDFGFVGEVEVTLHGQTVAKPVPLRIEEADGVWVLEAVGAFAFSDFGIKPYSAVLGTVKNADEIHVFVHLVTTPPKPEVPKPKTSD